MSLVFPDGSRTVTRNPFDRHNAAPMQPQEQQNGGQQATQGRRMSESAWNKMYPGQPYPARPTNQQAAYSPGQAQPQQSPYANSTPYGAYAPQPAPTGPAPANSGLDQQQQNQAMTAWTMPKQQLLQWGQGLPQTPALTPQPGMTPDQTWNTLANVVGQVNNTAANQQVGTYLGDGAPPPGWGQTNYNPQQMMSQATDMVRRGWQNPFAPPTASPGADLSARLPPAPVAGNAAPDNWEPWRNDDYFKRWRLNQVRALFTPGGREPDIRAEYERYLKLPKRDGRILKTDPRLEMEELQRRQIADAPYWQGRSDAPSGSVWDHPDNWAVRKRILANIAEYDKDPYADTHWAPLPDGRRGGRPLHGDPAGDQVRQLLPSPSNLEYVAQPGSQYTTYAAGDEDRLPGTTTPPPHWNSPPTRSKGEESGPSMPGFPAPPRTSTMVLNETDPYYGQRPPAPPGLKPLHQGGEGPVAPRPPAAGSQPPPTSTWQMTIDTETQRSNSSDPQIRADALKRLQWAKDSMRREQEYLKAMEGYDIGNPASRDRVQRVLEKHQREVSQAGRTPEPPPPGRLEPTPRPTKPRPPANPFPGMSVALPPGMNMSQLTRQLDGSYLPGGVTRRPSMTPRPPRTINWGEMTPDEIAATRSPYLGGRIPTVRNYGG